MGPSGAGSSVPRAKITSASGHTSACADGIGATWNMQVATVAAPIMVMMWRATMRSCWQHERPMAAGAPDSYGVHNMTPRPVRFRSARAAIAGLRCNDRALSALVRIPLLGRGPTTAQHCRW